MTKPDFGATPIQGTAKHTPGPWTVNDHVQREDCLYIEAARVGVATVYSDNTPGTDEARANARLIAAAPELLEVAEQVLAQATIETPRELLRLATTAIAKAESR